MRAATASVWTAALLNLGIAGLLATLFVVMATSLDPSDIVTAGIEPFTNAFFASSGFLGIALLTALAVRLWHTKRYKLLSLIFIAGETACVAWACVTVYNDFL